MGLIIKGPSIPGGPPSQHNKVQPQRFGTIKRVVVTFVSWAKPRQEGGMGGNDLKGDKFVAD